VIEAEVVAMVSPRKLALRSRRECMSERAEEEGREKKWKLTSSTPA